MHAKNPIEKCTTREKRWKYNKKLKIDTVMKMMLYAHPYMWTAKEESVSLRISQWNLPKLQHRGS